LQSTKEIREAVAQVELATPRYSRSGRQKIISQNLKRFMHPYFTAYHELQSLCLKILHYEKLKFGNDNDNVYGILFDASWLWEEYLWTLLKETPDMRHPQNKKDGGGIYRFEKAGEKTSGQVESEIKESEPKQGFCKHSRCRRYPDFYKPGEFILDAKYKHLNRSIPREDLYQLIGYMYVEHAHLGGFIFPYNGDSYAVRDPVGVLRGYGGTVCLYRLKIPHDAGTVSDFCNAMKKNEKVLIHTLNGAE